VTVVEGGEISNRKGVNVPGANLSIKSLTEKDKIRYRIWSKKQSGVRGVFFCENMPDDVLELRSILDTRQNQKV
jgi:pyruvate kinase